MSYWTGTHWVAEGPAAAPPPRPSRTRHVLGALAEGALLSLLVVALVSGTAFAAKGNGKGGGNNTITLAVAGQTDTARLVVSGDVTFLVTRSVTDDEVLWVTMKCYDTGGAEISRRDIAVIWGMWYSLEGSAGPVPTSGSTCTAYATWKPWLDHAIRGTVVEFAVAPS